MLRLFLQPAQFFERIEPLLQASKGGFLWQVALLSTDKFSNNKDVMQERKQVYPRLDEPGIREGVEELNEEMENLLGQLGAHQEEGGGQRQTLVGHAQQQQEQQQGPRRNEEERRKHARASTSPSPKLTHVNKAGDYHMVDVGGKQDTNRVAAAEATVVLDPAVFGLVAEDKLKKGNVLAVAQIAGIQAAKKTSDLIPLCHNIHLNQVRTRGKISNTHSLTRSEFASATCCNNLCA